MISLAKEYELREFEQWIAQSESDADREISRRIEAAVSAHEAEEYEKALLQRTRSGDEFRRAREFGDERAIDVAFEKWCGDSEYIDRLNRRWAYHHVSEEADGLRAALSTANRRRGELNGFLERLAAQIHAATQCEGPRWGRARAA